MIFFQQFCLDREKDIMVDLYMDSERLMYVIRTPNHHTGNLITNLAGLCGLETQTDENGLKVIRGEVPCYFDGDNRKMYILRLGNTKVANIYPDGRVELKASVPAISTMFRLSAPRASAFWSRYSPARRPSARKSAPM